MSTSNPKSANPLAMTLAPRSWPSCPILATRIRGRRPSAASNSSTIASIDSYSSSSLVEVVPELKAAAYTPCTMDVLGTCLPQAFSKDCDISPKVHLALAHVMHKFSRLSGSSPLLVLSVPRALFSSFARDSFTIFSSREAFTSFMRSICLTRTSVLSIFKTSTLSSFSSSAFKRYLLTPTTTSRPESILPCFLAALSSIKSLACPLLINEVMPPFESISSMIVFAL
mmetsp:Transcript_13675/g.28188  ORF Transcript_13675/g.28188 Transcript_13675/m.28188 type:complete len:227 (-) Transcript_13675:791-1471(-)